MSTPALFSFILFSYSDFYYLPRSSQIFALPLQHAASYCWIFFSVWTARHRIHLSLLSVEWRDDDPFLWSVGILGIQTCNKKMQRVASSLLMSCMIWFATICRSLQCRKSLKDLRIVRFSFIIWFIKFPLFWSSLPLNLNIYSFQDFAVLLFMVLSVELLYCSKQIGDEQLYLFLTILLAFSQVSPALQFRVECLVYELFVFSSSLFYWLFFLHRSDRWWDMVSRKSSNGTLGAVINAAYSQEQCKFVKMVQI